MAMLMLPVVGAGVVQATANATALDWPAVTVTDLGLSPERVQLAATPASRTECDPGERLVTERLPFDPMG